MADTNPTPGDPTQDSSVSNNLNSSAPILGAAEPNTKKIQEMRDAEAVRAAKMGQKQREREAGVKERVKSRKEEDAARSREAQNAMEAEQGKFGETKKEFRTLSKTRDKELAEFKKKQEAEKKFYDDQKKARETKRAKEKEYMGELTEMSRVKIARQHAIDLLKAELVRAKQKVEYEYRAAIDEAAKMALQKKNQLDDDIRQKKILADVDAKNKLYLVENAKRSRNTGLDIELRQQLGALTGKPAFETQRAKIQIDTQFHIKQRKMESEFTEKARVVEQGLQRAKADADRELHNTEGQIELEHRHAIAAAEQKRSAALQELEDTFERQEREKKVMPM